MKSKILWLILIALLTACTAPAPTATPTPAGPRTLKVMTHDSFSISESAIAAFETQHNVKVQFLSSGDTGSLVNQASLSKDQPLADVIYGIDNTFLSRAQAAGIARPLSAPPAGLQEIPAALQIDPQGQYLPIDYSDVCLNYDLAYFKEHNLPVPEKLTDLTRPEYKGLLVVENPGASSPGLAFLMATIATLGEEKGTGYLEFWSALEANDLLVVNDWNSAYYNEFSGGSGSQGVRPIVVSYATSPAAEVYFSEGQLQEPPTASLLTPGTCFRQIEFAAVLQGTQQPDLAEAFLAFLLSPTFQEDIPLQMWVYPALPTARLPEVFQKFAAVAQDPVQLPPETIQQNRERWISEWTATMFK